MAQAKDKQTLLIVEDSLDVQELLVYIFEDNFHISLADDMVQATKLLNEKKFDIVLTDFHFPGGNGDAVAELAHQKGIEKLILHSSDVQAAKSPLYTLKVDKLDSTILKLIGSGKIAA